MPKTVFSAALSFTPCKPNWSGTICLPILMATQLRYAQLFGDEIIASVRRLGLILFRFAMILSILRLIDEAKGTSASPANSHILPMTYIQKLLYETHCIDLNLY